LIAVFAAFSALTLGALGIHGLQLSLSASGSGAMRGLVVSVVAILLAALATFGSVELWRGKRQGRIACALLFGTFATANVVALFVMRNPPLVPAVVSGLTLVALLTPRARELTAR